ncbi:MULTISPECIES: hypothetical protein [Sanguibacteroides]|uniref:hypothetical protein n=1 Tax=Sanguibacteroides TaxID=1635148 RepID=UPI0011B56A64|nr:MULTISPECIES: hypothetical protein [Sanguibacteroides]
MVTFQDAGDGIPATFRCRLPILCMDLLLLELGIFHHKVQNCCIRATVLERRDLKKTTPV